MKTLVKTLHRQPIVLLVEDEPSLLEVLTELLTDEGYKVIGAENGQKAVEQLDRFLTPPDIIITDINMPVMDGFQFVQTLRERNAQIPVMVYSANSKDFELDDRLEGCLCVIKPALDLDFLLQTIKTLIIGSVRMTTVAVSTKHVVIGGNND